MEDSILDSVKQILNVDVTNTSFDLDILTGINASFTILTQLGLGPNTGFSITDNTTTWSQYPIGTGLEPMLHLVKTYVNLRTRQQFDPPTTSFLIKAMEDQLTMYEWRLNEERENLLQGLSDTYPVPTNLATYVVSDTEPDNPSIGTILVPPPSP